MGATAKYGTQKFWNNGSTVVGLNKQDLGTEKYWRFGSTAGDIFPQSSAASVYGNATASIFAKVSRPATMSASGQCNALVANTGHASAKLGTQAKWIYGQSSLGIGEQNVGTEKYWRFGSTLGDLIPKNIASMSIYGMCVPSMRASVSKSAIMAASGQCSAKMIRLIKGATDPGGQQKHWIFGLTFAGLSNANNSAASGQKYWDSGGPLKAIFPPSHAPAPNRARIICPYPTKRSEVGTLTFVKVIGSEQQSRTH